MGGDDQLDDLGRELRERVGADMRLEAEMLEYDAALVEKRRRSMADLAIEYVSRGDDVTALAGAKSIRGRLIYARGTLATIQTGTGTADLHLVPGLALRIDERATEGGITPRTGADSLRARLLEYNLREQPIELWAPTHHIEVSGRIEAVGKDHLILADGDGTEWVAQLADIAWVRPV